MMGDVEYKRLLLKYGIGFILSLILTFSSYTLVSLWGLDGVAIMVSIGVLAFTQMVVQLIFFLHLSDEKKPRWQTISFIFMALILAIVVVGTIWIMYHLNYNMMEMTPAEQTTYMIEKSNSSGF